VPPPNPMQGALCTAARYMVSSNFGVCYRDICENSSGACWVLCSRSSAHKQVSARRFLGVNSVVTVWCCVCGDEDFTLHCVWLVMPSRSVSDLYRLIGCFMLCAPCALLCPSPAPS
jgi:hypothetical protein